MRNIQMNNQLKAYTLVELLIVLLMITMLATIAVMQLATAKVKAEVARVKADFNSVGYAINSFQLDTSNYPQKKTVSVNPFSNYVQCMNELTSPIAYLSSLPKSPWFGKTLQFTVVQNAERFYARSGRYNENWDLTPDYLYWGKNAAINWQFPGKPNWTLTSGGPFGIQGTGPNYDPTNGAISKGIIMYQDKNFSNN